ncbi:non-structural maintenance of chromosomes element 3 homolog isoform X2 [Megachile rotundata]|uniref:non-structural maintenance of chromosomes element 3 homolog isoform X2 n=1 Tax=Megachile rotundata TaxID=143995 RepID=UPI003FCF1697
MNVSRNNKSSLSQKPSTRSNNKKRSSDVISLSQPIPSTSRSIRPKQCLAESPPDLIISEEQKELVNSVIRYIFALNTGKHIISKSQLIKNVFANKGKHFHRIMNDVQTVLSKIFGYRLIEFQTNKYMLVNEIQNQIAHIYPRATEGRQQVLLFLILTHIFMSEESCSEESLWNFLTNLDISCSDNQNHHYFGNVKRLITEVFVGQKYLDKLSTNANDSTKIEYKWGPRAEHEFSRRAALEFVSQIYCGRPISNWPLQFKTLQAREKANKSQ